MYPTLQVKTPKDMENKAEIDAVSTYSCAVPLSTQRMPPNTRGKIVLGIEIADGALCIHIDDDGPGIPVEAREKIFEPFVRLDKSRNAESGGLGLGLAAWSTHRRCPRRPGRGCGQSVGQRAFYVDLPLCTCEGVLKLLQTFTFLQQDSYRRRPLFGIFLSVWRVNTRSLFCGESKRGTIPYLRKKGLSAAVVTGLIYLNSRRNFGN